MSDAPMIAPTIFIIYGITGDLAKRKLLPSLYNMQRDGHLPDNFYIWGTSRSAHDANEYIASIKEFIEEDHDTSALDSIESKLRLVEFNIKNHEDYETLRTQIEQFEQEKGLCFNIIHYLSVPPQLFETVADNIGQGALNTGCSNASSARLLIEKPFGFDLHSGKKLAECLARNFEEDQIFRIDHFLGKETIQNILMLRFKNGLFQKIWNSDHISSIDIIAHEELGVGWRGEFYEQTGALRDMVQSHLLNLLGVITMDEPSKLSAEIIQRNLARILELVSVDTARLVIRAQYAGYKDEVGNPSSSTETFVHLPLIIDDNRWRGVPMSVETGKALSTKETRVVINFDPESEDQVEGNILEIRIAPNEGITLHIKTKKPGLSFDSQDTVMSFNYESDTVFHDAYESVIYNALQGDRVIFPSTEAVLASWEVLQPLLDAWSEDAGEITSYEKGANAADITH